MCVRTSDLVRDAHAEMICCSANTKKWTANREVPPALLTTKIGIQLRPQTAMIRKKYQASSRRALSPAPVVVVVVGEGLGNSPRRQITMQMVGKKRIGTKPNSNAFRRTFWTKYRALERSSAPSSVARTIPSDKK